MEEIGIYIINKGLRSISKIIGSKKFQKELNADNLLYFHKF